MDEAEVDPALGQRAPQCTAEDLVSVLKPVDSLHRVDLAASATSGGRRAVAKKTSIKSPATWTMPSTEKTKEELEAMAALMHAWTQKNFKILTTTWMSALAPEKQFMVNKSTDEGYCVLQSCLHGVLLWPSAKFSDRSIGLACEGAEPSYIHLTTLDEATWHVVPSSWKSQGRHQALGGRARHAKLRTDHQLTTTTAEVACTERIPGVREEILNKDPSRGDTHPHSHAAHPETRAHRERTEHVARKKLS